MEMEVRGRINEADDSLLGRIRRAGVKAKRSGSCLFFDLEITAGLLESGPVYYRVPDAVLRENVDAVYLIEAKEEGGYRIHYGVATVVCGLKGKVLWPYRKPRMKMGPTAVFSCFSGLATVTYYSNEGTFLIMSHVIDTNSRGFIYIKSNTVFFGTSLPEKFSFYSDAVKAARSKSHCIDCNCIHFSRKK